MPNQFKKHYSPDEARALLPNIKGWLRHLSRLRSEIDTHEQRLIGLMAPGSDLGGTLVNAWVRRIVEMQEVLMEFFERQIQLKDIDRGLIDFPSFLGGKEVFLCWELGEDDVEFWHELDTGYAGRERL